MSKSVKVPLRGGSGPIGLTCGGVRWRIRPDWGEANGPEGRGRLFGPEGLRLPEWLASGQATVVKQGAHRTVYHVHRGDLDFYVKHYPVPDCWARLRALVRPS